MQTSAQLLLQPQQNFAVYSVFVPVVVFGLEQTLDVERENLNTVHYQLSHMFLQAFISLPVGGEQQIYQQFVGDPDLLWLACRRSEPLGVKFLT